MNEQPTIPKKNKIIIISIFVLLILLAATFALSKKTVEPPSGEVEQSDTTRNESPFTPREKPLKDAVKVYFIDLENKRGVSETIGCGDSVISLSRDTPTEGKSTEELLSAALKFLIEEKDQFIGKSGYYNALYQSNLELEKVEISNSIAKIHFKGSVQLGGTCDSPRFEAQIKNTATQFKEISGVELFLNDQPLDLSQRE